MRRVWAVEHSVETHARAQAVWQLWADVERWPEWNAGVERIELRGPFAPGSTILMTPPGDEPVELRQVQRRATSSCSPRARRRRAAAALERLAVLLAR